MKSDAGATILGHLASVDAERAARAADADLGSRAHAIKHYQHQRFELTHSDLLAHPRYGGASRFFLEELYGPIDFTQRDAQFARIVPALVRLFPAQVVATVQTLGALHALSEQFDSAMARALTSPDVDARSYTAAWQACGDAAGRERQIALMEEVGRALDTLTRSPLLHRTLRLMRGPARAAGLGALQSFLEAGFDTFRAMHGADEFLRVVGERERALAALLFATDPARAAALGQLP